MSHIAGACLKEFITNYINDSVVTKQKLLADSEMLSVVENSAKAIIEAYKNGGKVLIAGNGGSAADAQHVATELVSKFMHYRRALSAIALTTNSSILTAIGNDYSYDQVFVRQIQAYGNEGDIFIAISTSGNSKNIVLAAEEAKRKGMKVIGLTGGGMSGEFLMDGLCDYLIKIPSESTPIIQDTHIMVEHILCALVEKEFI